MLTIPSTWNLNNNAQTKSGSLPFVLSNEPAEIRANENILRFEFTPQVANVGAMKASLSLRVVANVAVGDTFTISFSLGELILTASLTPSFNEFYTETATSTLAYRTLVAESIANELSNSLVFSNNYDITTSGDFIFVTALNFGDEFTLSVTPPTNILVASNTAGDDYFTYEGLVDYSLFADIYVSDELFADTVSKQGAEYIDTYVIPASGVPVNINVGGLIKDFTDVVLPNRSSVAGLFYKELDNSGDVKVMRPYFVVYGDYFRFVEGGEKKKRTQGVTSVRWSQNAAQDFLLPYSIDSWNPKGTSSFVWLTSCPNGKEVTYDSVEYLQTIVRKSTSGSDAFGLRCKLNFYDGTSYTVVLNDVDGYSDLGGNLSFEVSPLVFNMIGWETFLGKLVDTYEVSLFWQFGAGTYTSETKTYIMHRQCNEAYKNIIWVNEFGAWDSLTFRGESAEGVTRANNLVNRALSFDANTTDSISDEVTLTQRIDFSKTYNIQSSFVSAAHYRWLAGLLKSSSVFVWDEEFEAYRSITITESDYNATTSRTEQSLNITYRYTTNEGTISR